MSFQGEAEESAALQPMKLYHVYIVSNKSRQDLSLDWEEDPSRSAEPDAQFRFVLKKKKKKKKKKKTSE
ncbi:MAG TPA: hypothetical protein VFP59_19985 [Candidatus Angelobacter sp.]|nr:hypothetical protein [Candidatus Angelobacter sp.]